MAVILIRLLKPVSAEEDAEEHLLLPWLPAVLLVLRGQAAAAEACHQLIPVPKIGYRGGAGKTHVPWGLATPPMPQAAFGHTATPHTAFDVHPIPDWPT